MANPGCLYVVATPIGHLDDISLRALEVLKSVDLIAAEDTRHSQRLLNHFAIKTPLISLHDHNESQRLQQLQTRIANGEKIALISDAGTPLISDPGYKIVSALQQQAYQVIPIPGASAVIAALSVAGLPTDRFIFEGFLPAKGNARTERLQQLANETRTIVLYEASHRIVNLVELMVEIFGAERIAVIARELTKTFETIKHASIGELQQWIQADNNQQKGEFVVLIHGAPATVSERAQQEYQTLLTILLEELPLKKAVALAVKISNGPRNLLYDLALTLQKNNKE